MPPSDQITRELEAIDATLRGEAVDPEFADLAELALMVTAVRPSIPAGVAQRLDARAAQHFSENPEPRALRPRSRWRMRVPVFGGVVGALAAAAVIAVIVISVGGGGTSTNNSGSFSGAATSTDSSSSSSSAASSSAASSASSPKSSASSPKSSASSPGASSDGSVGGAPSRAAASGASNHAKDLSSLTPTLASPNGASGAASSQGPAASPVPNGRRTEQSAQLQLSAPASRINQVSQEVFNTVGTVNGIVEHSQVTSGTGGYAMFTLSIPSGNLQEAMTRLSQLSGAHVVSRTDQTQDVNNSYLSTQRALADAQALRSGLVKQLADAVTTTQIDSLTTQIHDAEARITKDQQTLNLLNSKISFSPLTVILNAGAAPGLTQHRHSGGFTFGRAAHDAGKVLETVAGVALIVLAALVPIAMLAALLAWVAHLWRRRQREQALDGV
jgi:hypothetical protein